MNTYTKWICRCLMGVALAAIVTAGTGCEKMPPQVRIYGQVLDMADDSPIQGAQVQAVDINGAPVGDTATTDAQGNYELTVPKLWDPDGVQEQDEEAAYGVYMLRCQAAGYQEFPSAIRPSLPIHMEIAAKAAPAPETLFAKLVIDESISTLTIIKLISLEVDTNLLGTISGRVVLGRDSDKYTGVLVVAVNEATLEAYTGFSGLDGNYVIFNVPAGSYRVEAYTQGAQFDPVDGVAVGAGEERTEITLSQSTRPLNTVSGNIQIVNAPGGSVTSVILAVESTFNEGAGRGEAPPGLRVGDVTGDFIIEDVPDGRYVVLAAFENDGLVRDPDQSIGGTATVYIEVPGPGGVNDITLPQSFKVTEALAVVQPGAEIPEAVPSLTPTLEWADDSSEDGYEVWVLDSFGNEVWRTEIPGVSGSSTVSLAYAGPALEAAMYYQFRVLSFREVRGIRSYISATEELKGVFYHKPAT